MPGKKAPPTQLSKEARSSPSGVKSGLGPPPPTVKFPSFQSWRIWCWVLVTAATRLGSPASKYLSPNNFGIDPAPEYVVFPAGGRRKLKIVSRVDWAAGRGFCKSGKSNVT